MTQNIKSARVTDDKESLLRKLIDDAPLIRFMLKCDACDTEFYEVDQGQVITDLPECCESPHIVMTLISELPTKDEEKDELP